MDADLRQNIHDLRNRMQQLQMQLDEMRWLVNKAGQLDAMPNADWTEWKERYDELCRMG